MEPPIHSRDPGRPPEAKAFEARRSTDMDIAASFQILKPLIYIRIDGHKTPCAIVPTEKSRNTKP